MKRFAYGLVLAVMLAGMCGVLMAEDGKPVSEETFWKKMLMGAIGGLVASLIGWAKNRDPKTNTQEPLSFKFMAITIVLGIIVGAIAGAMGKTLPAFFSAYESLPVWGVAMMGVEALLKVIFRQSIGMAKVLGILKEGAVNPPPAEPPKP